MKKIKVMKGALLAVALLIGINGYSHHTHHYKNAIGVELISTGGIGLTYKHFNKQNQAFELSLDLDNLLWDKNFNVLVGGTYQFYFSLVKGLRLYAGLGASVGLYMGNYNNFYLNADGVIGLEYKIKKAPFAFSLDWNPKLRLIKYNGFHLKNFSLGIKVAF